jgi:predicted porin
MLSAAVIVGFATAGHAEELAYAKKPSNPSDAFAADLPYKAEYKKAVAPTDDSLTWHGITLYGQLDMGLTYQSHGTPVNGLAGVQYNYIPSSAAPGIRGPIFGVGSNQLSGSFVALKGKQEVSDNLYAVFLLKTNFNPNYGVTSNGFGSISQNNGLPVTQQNSFGDSSRNGQAFNDQAWFGLSSPTWGTVTIGRQYALTSDGVINYDPLGSSGAFSLVGFAGATGGAGATEQRIYDNSIKYAVGVGPLRFAVEAQTGAGQFSGGQGNSFEGEVGFDYAGFSFDAIGAHLTDAVTGAPLGGGQVGFINGANRTLGAAGLNLTGAPAAIPLPADIGTNIGNGPGLVQGNVSDNTSLMLLAKYAIGQWKFYGGYENIRNQNPNNPLSAGSSLPGGYVLGAVNNNAFNTAEVRQSIWIGTKYAVRSDLDLTLAYYHIEQNSFSGVTRAHSGEIITNAVGNPSATCNNASSTNCSGATDVVSLVADWRFAKRFDLYAGVVYSQVANGAAAGIFALNGTGATVGGAGAGGNVLTVWAPSAGLKFSF